MPLIFKASVIGIQAIYDKENKCNIVTPIMDIINDIKHQICPLAYNEQIDVYSLDFKLFEKLKYFPKIEENSLLSIISKKFNLNNIPKLAIDLLEYTDKELSEKYQQEIINMFTTKTKIIFDSNKDSDTFFNIMIKAYGKSKLAFYHNFNTTWKSYENHSQILQNTNLIFDNGKIEFPNNNFEFSKNDVLIYGNFSNIKYNEYSFNYFKE